MATRVEVPPPFKKDLKRLARKYPAVLDEVEDLVTRLEADERPGDKIPNVGYDVYKVRLKNPAVQRGKSGGFRAIYYVRMANHVILITIYTESQQEDIRPEQIQQVIVDVTQQKATNDEGDNNE